MGKSRFSLPIDLDPGLLLAALLTLFASLPLLVFAGLPNTADGPVHLMRQAELNQAWEAGILYPRWAPDLAYGYGMPLFNYAPPLLYEVTQLLHLAGLELDSAMKGTLILMLLLASLGTYVWARDVFGPRAGLLAAAVYVYAPYRLREVYVQGNYGQLCGLAFYPLMLWSSYRLVTGDRRRDLLWTAASLAGLLLSHNISAMLFAPLWLSYLAFLLVSVGSRPESGMRLWRRVGRCVLAAGLGLGLSAVFWLPAFGERDLIRLSGITTGFFDFRHNFVALSQLLALPGRLDLSAVNPYYPLSLGVAQLGLAGLGTAAFALWRLRGMHAAGSARRSWLPAGHTILFGLSGLIYAGMALPQSRPIWEGVPLLALAEFPWRMLGPAILCAAVLAGALVYWVEQLTAGRWHRVGRWAAPAGIGLTLAANLTYLFPAQFITWGTPGPAEVAAYEAESGAIGTTSTGEFLPRWADRYPAPARVDRSPAMGAPLPGIEAAGIPAGARVSLLVHNASETRLQVSSPAPFTATFRTLYWPGWQVWIGGQPDDPVRPVGWRQTTDVQITRPDGLIQAGLPAGSYQVSLRLADTPIRRAAWIVSGLALAGCIGLAAWWVKRRPESQPPAQLGPAGRLTWSGALLAGAVLLAGVLVTRPLAGWFQVRSPSGQAYGAQVQLQATFGDQVQLLAMDLPGCSGWLPELRCSQPAGGLPSAPGLPEVQVEAGDSLPVVLYWQPLATLQTNYRVFVHLDAPDGQTYAGADQLNPADIPTSHWPPALYVRNPLAVDLPPELPPIRYTLTAGLYDARTGARLSVTGCVSCPPGSLNGAADALPLAWVWVLPPAQLEESAIPHRLDYHLGGTVELLGYSLEPPPDAAPGDGRRRLTLFWRSQTRLAARYTVFIHVVDAGGTLIGQYDAPPMNGLYPTDAWTPGQLIEDVHAIRLPEAACCLAIGLYDAGSLVRQAVIDAAGQPVPDDAILLQVTDGA